MDTNEQKMRRLAAQMGVTIRYGARDTNATWVPGENVIEISVNREQNSEVSRLIAHELTHVMVLGMYDRRTVYALYNPNRSFHELLAEGAVLYAMGEDAAGLSWPYLDSWGLPELQRGPIDWGKLRTMVQIVGEHLRAALEVA